MPDDKIMTIEDAQTEFNRLQAGYSESLKGRDMRRLGSNLRDFVRTMPDRVRSIQELIPGSYDGQRIIFAGSGPSLRQSVPYLRDGQRCTTLIASPSNTPFLLENGITPDILLCADILPIMREMLRGYERSLQHTAIVLPASADPVWRQEPVGSSYYWYMPYLDGAEANKAEVPINQLMNGFCPQVTAFILQGGCVANMAMGLIENLVRKFAVREALLTGVDYCEGDCVADERIEFYAGGLTTNAFIFNLAFKNVYKRARFSDDPPRNLTYVDFIYTLGMLQAARDVSFNIVNASGQSVLLDYMPFVSDAENWLSTDAGDTLVDREWRNEQLGLFMQRAVPFMLDIERREKDDRQAELKRQYEEAVKDGIEKGLLDFEIKGESSEAREGAKDLTS